MPTTLKELAKTALHDWHVAHGGRMVDFAGWSMPVQYGSIFEEHLATRKAVGLFDISHMGRLAIEGPDAARFIDSLVTRRTVDMKPGQIRYALACTDQGTILDDVLVYYTGGHETQGQGASSFCLVVNACNREKMVAWLGEHSKTWNQGNLAAEEIKIIDQSDSAMIAVQGPKGVALVDAHVEGRLRSLKYYWGCECEFDARRCYLSRTGYTGEDGCEIVCRAEDATAIWETLIKEAEEVGGRACGLAARDTLRLEAAMPLYGHELDETINPFQAGLRFAVNLGDRNFVGQEALKRLSQDDSQPVRIGLQVEGRRVPREGCTILHSEEHVGQVTSGTFSPTFDRPIAMGYVRPSSSAPGTHLAVDIRGRQYATTVVPLPFYQRGKS